MTTTFKKRQKEMKRMDKARMKAERRAQKKLAPASTDAPDDNIAWDEEVVPNKNIDWPADTDPQAQS
ncbi:MAG: hypothetical protein WB780_01445 [Candidatus Acidiferrales bacterium]